MNTTGLSPEKVCSCGKDVRPGNYKNQIWVHPPAHMAKENGYCLDRCIAEEVMQLWMKGITTTGCCCGHNKLPGYIGVIDSDIEKMKAMGYEIQPNENRPGAEDSFKPKSLLSSPQPEKAEEKLLTPFRTERDWTEDFSHENGNYENNCIKCDQLFMGHKRRVVCKICATPQQVGEANCLDLKLRGRLLF